MDERDLYLKNSRWPLCAERPLCKGPKSRFARMFVLWVALIGVALGGMPLEPSHAQDIQLPQGTFQLGPLTFQVGPPLPPETKDAPADQSTAQTQSQTPVQTDVQPQTVLSTTPPSRLPRRFRPLFEPFEARNLTAPEQWALQFALTLKGHYQGLMDGQWGRMSQSALIKFSRAEYQQEPLNIHTVDLAGQMQNEIRQNGWRYVNDQATRYHFLLPLSLMDQQSKRGAQANIAVWDSDQTSLAISARVENSNAVNIGHRRLLSSHRGSEAPLNVRRDNRFITSITDQRGYYTYVRSERAGSRWRSIVITAKPEDKGLFNVAVGSVRAGSRPSVGIAPGTYLEQMIDLATEYAAYSPLSDVAEPAPPSGPAIRQNLAIATGIFVNGDGFAITNASTVSDCDYILANGYNMSLKASFENVDVAILAPEETINGVTPLAFSSGPASVNDRVILASGFSGSYLGDDLMMSRGTVTSKLGKQGNPYLLAVSASISDEEPSAAILNRSGALLGLMNASNRASGLASNKPDENSSQDVAKGDAIKLLLDAYDVAYILSDETAPKSTGRIKSELSSAFAAVECIR